jgi:hypothetical protein
VEDQQEKVTQIKAKIPALDNQWVDGNNLWLTGGKERISGR